MILRGAPQPAVAALCAVAMALLLSWAVGILARGYWTPDEPREADIAWRMSQQSNKAVPLLAGRPFCEKPPLTYWAAGYVIARAGQHPWAARLPNLLYALVTALAVGALGRREHGTLAGVVAAAAIATLLLAYQVSIWLATDALLLAAVSVSLYGLHRGYYAPDSRSRLRGYTLMHAALAIGFMSKSAAAWMVPTLALATLIVWERRWREVLRWELYAGLVLQAAVILPWVGSVAAGPDGPEHLKVFFWNNLAGRFTHVQAPEGLQYATAHRNTPGKYLLELPVYLWPWTLLTAAAAHRAWTQRRQRVRTVRFALAVFVPTLIVLSLAATARNIYLAPALPGIALLLGWWAHGLAAQPPRWDIRALRATALLLACGAIVLAAAAALVGWDAWPELPDRSAFVLLVVVGSSAAALLALRAWHRAPARVPQCLLALLLAYGCLLVGPASQLYRVVDSWQDLGAIGRSIAVDAAAHPLILWAPDETTLAFIDLYARPAELPIAQTAAQLREQLRAYPDARVVGQLAGREQSPRLRALAARWGLHRTPAPAPHAGDGNGNGDGDGDGDGEGPLAAGAGAPPLRLIRRYALPNGRRYAMWRAGAASAAR